MKTHGDSGWEEYPSYLGILVPLVLDALDRLRIRITFFVVGQDAALDKNKGVLSEITKRGHEVGNHSFSHEPWLHLFDRSRIERELKCTEEHVEIATGQKPNGFRGPGFSCSPTVLQVLSENGYLFDASILPTYIGPLARAYYFRSARLQEEQKQDRAMLFGGFRDGQRSCKPFYWQLDNCEKILEIPVTTMPFFKLPFHLSYLIYIGRYSEIIMNCYMDMAIKFCQVSGTEPSFLLHPLDLLSGEQVPELKFFPGMDLPAGKKREYFDTALGKLAEHFQLVTMSVHARAAMGQGGIKSKTLRT
jgi:peptidoglycan-N-acetylglucosamine deacetylase